MGSWKERKEGVSKRRRHSVAIGSQHCRRWHVSKHMTWLATVDALRCEGERDGHLGLGAWSFSTATGVCEWQPSGQESRSTTRFRGERGTRQMPSFRVCRVLEFVPQARSRLRSPTTRPSRRHGEMPVWWVPLLRPSARVCRLLQRSCRLPVVHGGTGGTSAQTVEGQGAARDLAGQRSCWREACRMIGKVLNPKLWGGGPVHPSPPAFQPEKRN